LCRTSKPRTAVNIAAITSIYRPGPLKANVHKKYVKTLREIDKGKQVEYIHPIVEEILSETCGYTVFQEHFMLLAQKLSGFTPAEADKLRKTLVKKSLDTLDQKVVEREKAKEKFLKGAEELHGLSREKVEPLWKTIEFMSVYAFNKSHAVAYAIDSYYAAWLFTYHPKEWLATVLQSETSSPKGLSKALTEVQQLGYKIVPVDVNFSGLEWSYNEEAGGFVPPLAAIKGVGTTAAKEIIQHRPYEALGDLLYNTDGDWYHSKMNKTSFDSLCKIGAFGSLREMRAGMINHHRQLHEMLIGNYDRLRKGRKGLTKAQVKRLEKKGLPVPDALDVVRDETFFTEDWDRLEKVKLRFDITQHCSNDLVFPGGILEKFSKMNVISLARLTGSKKALVWFFVRDVQQKRTKNGKPYLRILASDQNSETTWLKVWGARHPVDKYSLWMCKAKGDPDWGPSTNIGEMRRIDTHLD